MGGSLERCILEGGSLVGGSLEGGSLVGEVSLRRALMEYRSLAIRNVPIPVPLDHLKPLFYRGVGGVGPAGRYRHRYDFAR